MNAETKNYTDRTWDEIVLETREDAELVLAEMGKLLEVYGLVAVSDLYDLVDIVGNYADVQRGWTDLQNAEVRSVSEGYSLSLPKPEPIDFRKDAEIKENSTEIDVKDPQGNVVGKGRTNGMTISIRLDDAYLFEKVNEGICSSVSIGGGEINLIEHPNG